MTRFLKPQKISVAQFSFLTFSLQVVRTQGFQFYIPEVYYDASSRWQNQTRIQTRRKDMLNNVSRLDVAVCCDIEGNKNSLLSSGKCF